MSTAQKIKEVLQCIPNFRYVSIEKVDDIDYDAYVVDLDPSNVNVISVDAWGGCCGGCGA